jgi:hypothetical protein
MLELRGFRRPLRIAARITIGAVVVGITAFGIRAGTHPPPQASSSPPAVTTVPSSVEASDGARYRITNHLTRDAIADGGPEGRQWLLVWTADQDSNLPEPSSADPDFLAVVDVTEGSGSYGKVVNTVTIDSVTGNGPHNLQPLWHKGEKLYAGGILSDFTYIFDIERLPVVHLSGVVPATALRCGSVPANYSVLADGTAYATHLGSAATPGACEYTNGEVREGSGHRGSPGELVRISPSGEILSESPTSLAGGEQGTEIPSSPVFPGAATTWSCVNIPALARPTCANPYGVAVREDLDRLVLGDFAEFRHPLVPVRPPAFSVRDTVRVLDISDLDDPRLVSVTHLPDGPRTEIDVRLSEAFGSMAVTATNRPEHRGAFVGTTNGAIYYTPDITAADPRWRQVYDEYHAFTRLFPTGTPTSSGDSGGWTQVSPDDRFLFRVVMGGGPFSPGETDTGMLLVLDLEPLLSAGPDVTCVIDTPGETSGGGAEPDCPRLVSVVPIHVPTSGGPNPGAMDTFQVGPDGYFRQGDQVSRVAVANYFLAATGHGGDSRVCLYTASPDGQVALDTSFRDEHLDVPCLDFKRDSWPHGQTGSANPHGMVFAIADRDLR